MTERTLKVSLTAEMAEAIAAYAEDQLNQASNGKAVRDLTLMKMQANEWLDQFHLMNKGTKLYENDQIVLFEHPVKGNEMPLMAYFKGSEHFEEDIAEFDADAYTAEIILEDQRQWIEGL